MFWQSAMFSKSVSSLNLAFIMFDTKNIELSGGLNKTEWKASYAKIKGWFN